ncbi:hypothetical protein KW797_02810 [Candidatus Parcubacteria bacterium]|nr:hypothetical protein [Candidatus Parcubacteria bacterium]
MITVQCVLTLPDGQVVVARSAFKDTTKEIDLSVPQDILTEELGKWRLMTFN